MTDTATPIPALLQKPAPAPIPPPQTTPTTQPAASPQPQGQAPPQSTSPLSTSVLMASNAPAPISSCVKRDSPSRSRCSVLAGSGARRTYSNGCARPGASSSCPLLNTKSYDLPHDPTRNTIAARTRTASTSRAVSTRATRTTRDEIIDGH